MSLDKHLMLTALSLLHSALGHRDRVTDNFLRFASYGRGLVPARAPVRRKPLSPYDESLPVWRAVRSGGGFLIVAHTPHNGLAELIEALLVSILAHGGEAKLQIATGGLAHADGRVAAEVTFHEGGLVALSPGAPGVNTDHLEVAGLALAAAGPRDQILRLLAGGIGDPVELKPGHYAQRRRGGIVADGAGQLELDKARQHPAGYPSRLVAFRRDALRSPRTARACGQPTHQTPIFAAGFLFVLA